MSHDAWGDPCLVLLDYILDRAPGLDAGQVAHQLEKMGVILSIVEITKRMAERKRLSETEVRRAATKH